MLRPPSSPGVSWLVAILLCGLAPTSASGALIAGPNLNLPKLAGNHIETAIAIPLHHLFVAANRGPFSTPGVFRCRTNRGASFTPLFPSPTILINPCSPSGRPPPSG